MTKKAPDNLKTQDEKPKSLREKFAALAGSVRDLILGKSVEERRELGAELTGGKESFWMKTKGFFKEAGAFFGALFGGAKKPSEKLKVVESGAEDDVEKGDETLGEVLEGVLDLPAGLRISSDLDSDRLHPVTGKRRSHKGIDMPMPVGTLLKWFLPGEAKVLKVAYQKDGAGHYVNVLCEGKVFKFFHLQAKSALKVGQKIAKGDLLGLSGATGVGTGPHLHLEVWKGGKVLDPIPYLPKYLQGQVLAKRKGKPKDPFWGDMRDTGDAGNTP